MLTSLQLAALRAAIGASTDPLIVQYRTPATRSDWQLAARLNEPSATIAWRRDADPALIDDASDWPAFDALTAGKRDSWAMFLARPRDFGRAKVRSWVTDVWGAAVAASAAEAILLAGTEAATIGEAMLGGALESRGTVSALDRAYVGGFSTDDVAAALNL